MSDGEESNANPNLSEEVDDLFGDEGEPEEQVREAKSEGVEIESDEEGDQSEEELKEIRSSDLSLPRHAMANEVESDTYVLKLPVFLNIDAHPFDANEFKDRLTQTAAERSQSSLTSKQIKDELIAEKLMNENTIRWRYSNSGNDEIIKQSNAHFVQWDDGTISLKIGSEFFDYKQQPLSDQYLVRSHESLEILQCDTAINKSVNLIPASTFTSTHRKLTQAVKSIQKKDKILNTITKDDPLLKQRLADENERKSLKLKRQIELKRRLQEERLERTNSPVTGAGGNGYDETTYERFARTYGNDEYDEEDDFIANDEEEEEEVEDGDDQEELESENEEDAERGAERLRQLKEEGAAKYHEDASLKEVGSDEEASRLARKRRRIVDSDEDEE
ncbi:uncharacterized protein PRCAT00000812001 [Priceomyces carsonii]|uniref:uncharacterized protein n=1 Tax=Priceomyces carsonii TaxID=28549 RepID=UPI002EDA06B6|nr:unnamed protein product [Priceomyces carsonii]